MNTLGEHSTLYLYLAARLCGHGTLPRYQSGPVEKPSRRPGHCLKPKYLPLWRACLGMDPASGAQYQYLCILCSALHALGIFMYAVLCAITYG